MFRGIIVVWENLSKQHVHVVCLVLSRIRSI